MNKLLQQKEHGEPIFFTELLKEIPSDDVLLELFPNIDRPGHSLVTRRDLEILKLHLKGIKQKAIAATLDIAPGQAARCIRKLKSILDKKIPQYIVVDIPLLNPTLYAEKLNVLSKRQQDVWVLYAQGYNRQQIAEALGISPGAVAGHIRHAVRRFCEHDQYCAAEKRNLESVELPLTRGEIKIIIKALHTYEQELERGISNNINSDWKGKLPFETQIVADLYEKSQMAIYGESSIKLLPNLAE